MAHSLLDRLMPRRAGRAALYDLAASPWLMEPTRVEAFLGEMRAALASTSRAELRAFGEQQTVRAQEEPRPYAVIDGVAHLAISGPMIAGSNWILDLFGEDYTDTTALAPAIADAAAASDVRGIVLEVDSPGGQVDGTREVADAVRAATASKPVHAHISGSGHSAALWAIASATEVTASQYARVGSIGVYRPPLYDTSRALENEGIAVHALRSGPLKGIGQNGVPVTAAEVDYFQSVVDELAAEFFAAIGEGRGIEMTDELKSGRDWNALRAVELGLVDRIASLEDAHAMVAGAASAGVRAGFTAPEVGAVQEDIMPQEGNTAALDALRGEYSALEARLQSLEAATKKAEARAELAEATVAQVRAEQRKAIIDRAQAEGRIVPATRAAAEKLGEAFAGDLDGLKSALAAYPVITHAQAAGATPEQGTDEAALSEGDRFIAKAFGLTEQEMKVAAKTKAISVDGTAILGNGSTLPLRKGEVS